MATSTLATSRCRGVSTIITLSGGCDTFLSLRSTSSMATNSSRSPGLSSWRWRSFSSCLPRSRRETSSSTRPRASTAARRSSPCLRASGPAPGTSVSASQRWYLYWLCQHHHYQNFCDCREDPKQRWRRALTAFWRHFMRHTTKYFTVLWKRISDGHLTD